jgi:hypothetical protein
VGVQVATRNYDCIWVFELQAVEVGGYLVALPDYWMFGDIAGCQI